MFAERMRYTMARTTSLTVSAGVAMVAEGDDAKIFLTRADSALYAAKAAGRNAVYCHNGEDAFPAAEPGSDGRRQLRRARREVGRAVG